MGKKAVVSYPGYYPVHRFTVKLDDYTLHCSKVSELTDELEVEEVAEGGNNSFPNVFPRQNQKAGSITLERAVVEKGREDFFQKIYPGVEVSMVSIQVLRPGGGELKMFFRKGLIVKRVLSNLDAMGNDLIVDTLQIIHSGLMFS